MVKGLLIFLAFLFAAVYLGSEFSGNPGYILLAYHNWSIEISLWFATIAILLLIITLAMLLRISSGFHAIIHNWRAWVFQQRATRTWQLIHKAFVSLVEGKFSFAQHLFTKAATRSEYPLILFLAAAFTARARGKLNECDGFLHKAQDCNSANPLVVGLVQAQWELQDKRFTQALLTLKTLLSLAPRHPQILNLLHSVYLQLQDWQSLQELLPRLRGAKFLSQEELAALELTVYRALLAQAFQHETPEEVSKLWQNLPKTLRKNSNFLADYCEYLIDKKHCAEAEYLLQRALKAKWESRLIQLYGRIHSDEPLKQLKLAKAWLEVHGDDPDLLLCLGRLNRRYSLWGQARDYLQASIHAGGGALAYYELAQVLEQLGEHAAALNYYKQVISKFLN